MGFSQVNCLFKFLSESQLQVQAWVSFESRLMQSAFNGSKAAPETSTTPANATGILDSSLNSLTIKDQQPPQTDSRPRDNVQRPRASIHSYSIIPAFKEPNLIFSSRQWSKYTSAVGQILPRLVHRRWTGFWETIAVTSDSTTTKTK